MPFQLVPNLLEFFEKKFYPCVGVMNSYHVTRGVTKMSPSFFSILNP